jgi:hypothetical protein
MSVVRVTIVRTSRMRTWSVLISPSSFDSSASLCVSSSHPTLLCHSFCFQPISFQNLLSSFALGEEESVPNQISPCMWHNNQVSSSRNRIYAVVIYSFWSRSSECMWSSAFVYYIAVMHFRTLFNLHRDGISNSFWLS